MKVDRLKAIKIINQCEALLVHIFQAYIDNPNGGLFMMIHSCMSAMQIANDKALVDEVDDDCLAMLIKTKETLNTFKNNSESTHEI